MNTYLYMASNVPRTNEASLKLAASGVQEGTSATANAASAAGPLSELGM